MGVSLKEYKIESSDGSIKIELKYIQTQQLKYVNGDKVYPLFTQCLMFRNGLLISEGTISKDTRDKDNEKYAVLLSTKKMFNNLNDKNNFSLSSMKKRIFDTILNDYK